LGRKAVHERQSSKIALDDGADLADFAVGLSGKDKPPPTLPQAAKISVSSGIIEGRAKRHEGVRPAHRGKPAP
jgi:hypothetical protein